MDGRRQNVNWRVFLSPKVRPSASIFASREKNPEKTQSMTPEKWTEVDRYFVDLLLPPDPVLEEALRSSAAAGLPAINVAPNQGKLLQVLAQVHGSRKILEIGTLGGYSTIWLARALPPGGRLVTLEADPRHAEVARANIARAGFGAVVELRLGRAVDTLPQIAAEGRGPFDLIFIDADKPGYSEYFGWAMKLSRRGTVIIADNVVRKGEVVNAGSADETVQGVRRFNELLAAERRVNATAIQTVGSKGYDGFAIAVVVSEP
jgi:predicted O-methyltransferase YrrM